MKSYDIFLFNDSIILKELIIKLMITIEMEEFISLI